MKRRNKHRRSKQHRRSTAMANQEDLVNLIRQTNNDLIKQNAVYQLVSLNRKHRLKMPNLVKTFICIKCYKLRNAKLFRTRIKHGQIIQTCHVCNYTSRIGGGPKSHRV